MFEQQILEEALSLPAINRVLLVEKLLASLDLPDVSVDKAWSDEVEARIDAYNAGDLESVASEQVFNKYKTT
jgi:putative addiction module component (TIGR02574 family)